jgi:uncharacterized protein YidB (DUF937 family)
MIRQESYPFFVRLLEGGTLDSLIGFGYKLRMGRHGRNLGDDDTNDNAGIKKVIDEVGGINEKQAERLFELVNAARTLGEIHLQYNFRFAHRPEAVTWKEFHGLLALWKQASVAETISGWISSQSAANSIDPSDIETELFETFLNARDSATSKAAEATTVEKNAALCGEAQSLLKMTDQFLSLPGLLGPERLGKLYGKALHWVAFRVNPADADLRAAERTLLYSLLDRASEDQAPAILEKFKPWELWPFGPVDAETARLRRELRDGGVARLLPKVERAFSAYINRPESFRLLSTPEGSLSFRYVLFFGDRLPWGAVIRDALLGTMQIAKSDDNAHEKANEFLQLLVDAAANLPSYIARDSAVSIVGDREFVAALWSGATSRPIQFRMVRSYLSKREALIQLGADEGDLALPPELARDNEMAQANEPKPTGSESGAKFDSGPSSLDEGEGHE